MAKQKIKRSRFGLFLNTAPEEDEPVWSLVGEGVTELTVAYNPQTSEVVYINQDSGTTDVESYKPTIETPMTAIKGDEVFEFVDGLRRGRKVLDECVTQCVMVYLYEEEQAGAWPAEQNNCAIQIDEFGGAGGESTKLTFTINLQGDAVQGTFNPDTKTFTPAA